MTWFLVFQSARPRVRTRLARTSNRPGILVSIRAPSGEDATIHAVTPTMDERFQSARPRVRTRLGAVVCPAILRSFNPRALG